MNMFITRIILLGIVMVLTVGCGSRFGGAEPTATIAPLPTFTPTPATADAVPTAEPTPDEAPTASADNAPIVDDVDSTSQTDAATAESSEDTELAPDSAILLPTPTDEPETVESPTAAPPVAEPLLVVNGEIVNVRSGPGTGYAQISTASDGEEFALTGRNEVGDWWQVCCFAEQPGWIYGPLAEVRNAESVAVAADIPDAPVSKTEPATQAAPESAVAEIAESPATEAPQEAAPEADAEALAPGVPLSHSGTAGNFDPRAQYQIVNYRVLGFDDNNGGIFNNGGQHMIFVNVIDQNGNGVDGAVVKDAVNNKIAIVTGTKGPGRAEFEMFGEKFKLYVASDSSGDVSSQISNQMDTVWPHIPDIIGKLGPLEEELSICPTPDVRCEPPFYRAHWSYEVTFQKVK